jgi:hypothetical protein
MPDYDRNFFRVASLLHEGLLRLHKREIEFSLRWWEFEHCQQLHRKLRKARSRNLTLAAATVADDLERALHRLREQLTSLLSGGNSLSISPRIPTLKDLYSEVQGLFAEFDDVDYNLKRREIVVTTEPIELEDVCLGEFEIRLDLNGLGKSHPYQVVAKDPHHAAAAESLTHPHVRHNHLCEGEGALPIQRALESGRLADFFQIVNQILHTYNSGSAYAPLDEWAGERCADCGHTVAANAMRCCDQCDCSVCDDCLSYCGSCEHRTCASCRHGCSDCSQSLCCECVNSCEVCEDTFCQSCLSHGKCKSCDDCNSTKIESGTGNDLAIAASSPAAGEADLALQSASLGEAALPARPGAD